MSLFHALFQLRDRLNNSSLADCSSNLDFVPLMVLDVLLALCFGTSQRSAADIENSFYLSLISLSHFKLCF